MRWWAVARTLGGEGKEVGVQVTRVKREESMRR